MRMLSVWFSVPLLCGPQPRLFAQEPGEHVRVICDPADPKNSCPGRDCFCTEDTLEVTFDGGSQSTLEYTTFVPDAPITMTVVMDTVSRFVQSWSYGVEHDGAFLTLHAVTIDGTDVEAAKHGGFVVADMVQIETCKADPDPKCRIPQPGTGFIAAIILSFGQPLELEVRRNSLARASYSLHANAPPPGTLIQVVDHLKKKSSPPVAINITIEGRSRLPTRVVDGAVTQIAGASPALFSRGDADGDGRLNVHDAIAIIYTWLGAFPPRFDCEDALDADDDGQRSVLDAIPVLQHVFQRGRDLPPPFRECGADRTQDLLGCVRSNCP